MTAHGGAGGRGGDMARWSEIGRARFALRVGAGAGALAGELVHQGDGEEGVWVHGAEPAPTEP